MTESYAPWCDDVQDILNSFDVDVKCGLTPEQVMHNRSIYGLNELPKEEGMLLFPYFYS